MKKVNFIIFSIVFFIGLSFVSCDNDSLLNDQIEDETMEQTDNEDSTEEDSTEEDSTEEDSTEEDSTEEDSTEEDSTEEDSTEEDSTEEDSTEEDSTEEYLETIDVVNVNVWLEESINHNVSPYRFIAMTSYKSELYCFGSHNNLDNNIFKFDTIVKNWIPIDSSIIENGIDAFINISRCNSGGLEISGDTLFMTGPTGLKVSASNMFTQEQYFGYDLEVPNLRGSEIFSALAYNGNVLFVAYHSLDYASDPNVTERLYAINKEGKIIFDSKLQPDSHRRDYTHAMTCSSNYIYHAKKKNIARMDESTGEIIEVYRVKELNRPSGIVYLNNSLWIVDFYGTLVEIEVIK